MLYFFEVFGLKVNLSKSRMYGVGNVSNMGKLAEYLGYEIGILPSTYLGLPLGASYKNSSVWDPVVFRINKRLAGWK